MLIITKNKYNNVNNNDNINTDNDDNKIIRTKNK